MTYQLYKAGIDKDIDAIKTTDGTKSFLLDPANTDYQAYLKWLADGNTPLPAENS